MQIIKRIYIPYEYVGLKFRDGRFVELLMPGRKWIFDPFGRTTVDIVWQGNPWIEVSSSQLRQLRDESVISDHADFIDLKDNQRALVWLDGRFYGILGPGLYGYWKTPVKTKVEVVDVESVRFQHPQFDIITKDKDVAVHLNIHEIEDGGVGVLYVDGEFEEILNPGRYAFWKNTRKVRIYAYDLREKILDVTGQEIMTADKVTLRLNAVLSYFLKDVRKVAESSENIGQALYREIQLIIRAEVGGRTLDQLLADKSTVANEALNAIRAKAADYGVEVKGLGIRDVILPGDMKELLNQVIEAEKAAQANNIKRREETAAMRSQLNSAKLIEQNPTLMRLRELESVEKITEKANLQIFVGDGQELSKRIVKLI
ncbi:slipin family protein [Puniceicoccus vermicola]|uniref:Slipin family protein n=1 Tax=Puniceicoccus vermicola TaxID=388746 RepID=A0A7X1AYI3_9BACT|nr:slipin family protein [Puniceicoccus vermicola]MBC2601170.1 slipin family protein [Puniceicoccus vermicola]